MVGLERDAYIRLDHGSGKSVFYSFRAMPLVTKRIEGIKKQLY